MSRGARALASRRFGISLDAQESLRSMRSAIVLAKTLVTDAEARRRKAEVRLVRRVCRNTKDALEQYLSSPEGMVDLQFAASHEKRQMRMMVRRLSRKLEMLGKVQVKRRDECKAAPADA